MPHGGGIGDANGLHGGRPHKRRKFNTHTLQAHLHRQGFCPIATIAVAVLLWCEAQAYSHTPFIFQNSCR